MSITETLLIFVGIPAAIVAAVAVFVYAGGARRARRYRPGRPFSFTPVWFLATPTEEGPSAPSRRVALTAGSAAARKELTPVQAPVAGPGETGGASDRW